MRIGISARIYKKQGELNFFDKLVYFRKSFQAQIEKLP